MLRCTHHEGVRHVYHIYKTVSSSDISHINIYINELLLRVTCIY